MKVIRISGIIARWEMDSESNVTPETLQKSLDDAGGEELEIFINSPGGDVQPGLEMYSMIKNYKGHTETRIVAMAASMGSIIALAGNKRTAETTASYMIHNASGIAWGDHREVARYAERLKAVSGHLSNIYTERTGIKNSEIRQQMDDTTWAYGSELESYGFEMVDPETEVNIETAKFEAHTRYDNFIAEMKNHPEEHVKDIEKVAASIAGTKSQSKPPAANAGKNKPEENISVKNLEELKAQFPDIYAAAVKAGVDQEKDRVTAHIKMGESAGAMKLAVKNITEGNDFSQTVSAEYMAEGLKNRDISNRNDDDLSGGLGADAPPVEGEESEEELQAYEDALNNGSRGKKKAVKK